MISVYSDCVYDMGRFIVYLVIYYLYFFVGSGVGCVPSICILGLCTQKYLEFSGL
nr:MAG TPA: hypothetical protein [Caudoviricetes sp.]